jgi:hypothetical protein
VQTQHRNGRFRTLYLLRLGFCAKLRGLFPHRVQPLLGHLCNFRDFGIRKLRESFFLSTKSAKHSGPSGGSGKLSIAFPGGLFRKSRRNFENTSEVLEGKVSGSF